MKKLNNKGFTLIEILAVVAIITLISLIAVPSVLSTINKGKESSYNILMENINTASKSLFEEVEYTDSIEDVNITKKDETEYITIELQILVKYGFLSGNNDKNIINPKNNEDICACKINIIKVSDGNKVTYTIENASDGLDYCPSTDDYLLKKENKKEENESSDKEDSNESLQDKPLLSTVESGSYVKYVGGNRSTGTNANKSVLGNGWCGNEFYYFNTNGWRIAYKENGNVYLISAGAPECVSTISESTSSYNDIKEKSISIILNDTVYYSESSSTGMFNLIDATNIDMDKIEVSSNTPLYTCNYGTTVNSATHISNLNKKALAYCNADYAAGGECGDTTTWAFNEKDFKNITGVDLNNDICYGSSSGGTCKITSDLIIIGSFYWVSKESDGNYTYMWDANYNVVSKRDSSASLGLRPVIKLDANIVITGGNGTKENPYTIAKK